MPTEFNILIGGKAGQGLVTIGQMLGKVIVRKGYHLHVTQSYQSRVRGGHNTFAVRVGTADVCAPREEVDVLVALDEETLALHAGELAQNAVILSDAAYPKSTSGRHLLLPLSDMAKEIMHNTVMFGALGYLLGYAKDEIALVIRQIFADKDHAVITENEQALDAVLAWMHANSPAPEALAAPPVTPGTNMMITAHEALALGALSAGLKFCSFYPMSPSTTLSTAITEAAGSMDLVVEQAEDEIAAINMAIGASFAGALALVATSGGGFSLMVEGVSLAGITETPIVIAVAMRPGPGTGLPTRTEQADLDLVLYAGHGEFPRAILAPGTPEQSFALARQAFMLSQKYQTPVFILTDQYLSDSYRDCAPFPLSPLNEYEQPSSSRDAAYQRYAITDDGISPRTWPGCGPALVVVDSDEHTPDGHLTEDLTVRVAMHEKRLRKEAGLVSEVILPDFYGPEDPDLLLVCWGSTIGAVREASARPRGGRVAVCHFTQLWPLRAQDFIPRFEQARRVVMVESNATAQLAGLIRKESGFFIPERILRYDGLPMTSTYILKHLESMTEQQRG